MLLFAVGLTICIWIVDVTSGFPDVSHITIPVSSLSQSLIFYQDLLGGKLVADISSLQPVQGDDYQKLFGEESIDLTEKGTHEVGPGYMFFTISIHSSVCRHRTGTKIIPFISRN